MVKKINEQEFQAEACAADAAVVDFSAVWCGPCRMLAPVLEEVSEEMEDRVSFYGVDVDECPGLAEKFRVRSVPCLVLLKKGVFVDQSVGFLPKNEVEAWIRKSL